MNNITMRAYTNSGRLCKAVIGISKEGNLYWEKYFSPMPCKESYEDALNEAIDCLLATNKDIAEKTFSYTFKTKAYFAYWSCSGVLTMSKTNKNAQSWWVGDALIQAALEKVPTGAACILDIKGKTLQYVIDNIEDIVEYSRIKHTLDKFNDKPKDWRTYIKSVQECKDMYAVEQLHTYNKYGNTNIVSDAGKAFRDAFCGHSNNDTSLEAFRTADDAIMFMLNGYGDLFSDYRLKYRNHFNEEELHEFLGEQHPENNVFGRKAICNSMSFLELALYAQRVLLLEDVNPCNIVKALDRLQELWQLGGEAFASKYSVEYSSISNKINRLMKKYGTHIEGIADYLGWGVGKL